MNSSMNNNIRRLSIIPLSLIAWVGLLSSLPHGFEEEMNSRREKEAVYQHKYDSLNSWSVLHEDMLFDPIIYEIIAPSRYQTFQNNKGDELTIWHKSHIAEKNDKMTSIIYYWTVHLDTLFLYPRIRVHEESLSRIKNNDKKTTPLFSRHNHNGNSLIILEAIEIDNREEFIIDGDNLKLVTDHTVEDEVYTKTNHL